tara:strand:- start:91 stop:420 length:330 start_codon:yes stop_codon:yes gene_type:complete
MRAILFTNLGSNREQITVDRADGLPSAVFLKSYSSIVSGFTVGSGWTRAVDYYPPRDALERQGGTTTRTTEKHINDFLYYTMPNTMTCKDVTMSELTEIFLRETSFRSL